MIQTRRFQHGSLIKRGKRDKVWVGRWWEEVPQPDGSSKRIRRSEILGPVSDTPTRSDAERLLNKRLSSVNADTARQAHNWTLRSYIEDRWLPEVLPTVKRSTQNHYNYVSKVQLIPELGDMQMRLITRHEIQDMLNRKRAEGLSWRTVKHIRVTLGTILRKAEFDDLIESNPVPKTKLPRRGLQAEKPEVDRRRFESFSMLCRSLLARLLRFLHSPDCGSAKCLP